MGGCQHEIEEPRGGKVHSAASRAARVGRSEGGAREVTSYNPRRVGAGRTGEGTPRKVEGKRRSKPTRGHPGSGAPRRPRLSPHSPPAPGTSQAPGSPGTSVTGTGLRGEECSGASGKLPSRGRSSPPLEMGWGRHEPHPALWKMAVPRPTPATAPRAGAPERGHSLSRGRWTPCLFVWSQRPPRQTTPYCSAPAPAPPLRPPGSAPPGPPLATCLARTNHTRG